MTNQALLVPTLLTMLIHCLSSKMKIQQSFYKVRRLACTVSRHENIWASIRERAGDLPHYSYTGRSGEQ